MEKEFSDSELINIYKDLYFINENSEKFIDFENLVETYMLYLSMFFEKKSSIYGDIVFLIYIIDGFNFIYRSYINNEDISSSTISRALIEYDSLLRNKNFCLERCVYTDSDAVLIYSLKLAIMFKDMGLVDDNYDEIQRMFYNSYVIENEEKGRGEDGMENRKCYS